MTSSLSVREDDHKTSRVYYVILTVSFVFIELQKSIKEICPTIRQSFIRVPGVTIYYKLKSKRKSKGCHRNYIVSFQRSFLFLYFILKPVYNIQFDTNYIIPGVYLVLLFQFRYKS